MTILEVLISGGLFVLALALCGELAVMGIRSRNQSMNKNGEFRANLTLLHQLQVDLKETRQIYLPDLNDLAPHQPGKDSAALVLRLPGPDGSPRVVGWNIQDLELRRVIYKPDFNPAVPASHVPQPQERTLNTRGIGNFTLQLEPPGQNYGSKLLHIQMDCLDPALQKIEVTQRLEL
ncbi:hypothetical protein ABS71_06700 [bacterium SCN 62-11]|nr:hypothetical protein [Candidatus Eremiobacteraeota bacterium]ODT73719.1 MAG: hypothetical protein ABS71_06700 [bacterium SCN 62-11]